MARDANRFLQLIEAPAPVENLKLFRMIGQERLSEPFHFRLTIRSQGDIPPAAAWIGSSVTFSFGQSDNAERKINGRCSSFEHLHQKGAYVEFAIEVAPAFEALRLTRDRRLFNDRSVRQVVETVLGEHRISIDSGRYGPSPTRPYIVQHDESDFDLVTRLLADEGKFYFFRYDEGAAPFKHRMVLAGDAQGYYDGEPFELSFRRDHLMRGLNDLQMGYQSAPAKVVTHDYDFKKPGDLTPVSSPSKLDWAAKQGQVFQWAAGYEDVASGQERAKLRVEGAETGAVVMRGVGNYSAMAPAARFHVDDERLQPRERHIVVRSVSHEVFDPYSSDEGEPSFHQSFEAQPSAQVFRPAKPAAPVAARGPQTAVVLDQNDPEGFGRIKVRFHWDHTGHSTCWVRVVQQWAGDGIGAQFVPRPGMEVLVDFIDGRVDRPVVVGCFYNGRNKHSFAVPENLTQAGWRTSGKGGRPHHLLFEDKEGGERVDLLAGRDFERIVQQDETARISRDLRMSAKTIDIKADDQITLTVGGSRIVITGHGIWIDSAAVHLNGGGAPQPAPWPVSRALAAAPGAMAVAPAPAAGAMLDTAAAVPSGGGAGNAGVGAGAAVGAAAGGGAKAAKPKPQPLSAKALGKEGEALANKSPSLSADLQKLQKGGWRIVDGKAGGGSFADQRGKLITIDPNNRASAATLVQTVAHETGHATYTGKPDVSSRAAFIRSNLADEGAATLSNVRARREILAHGGADIGIAGNPANAKAYDAAYDALLKDKDAAKARNMIGSIFGRGERTSNTGQTYEDYYGGAYDKAFPPKK